VGGGLKKKVGRLSGCITTAQKPTKKGDKKTQNFCRIFHMKIPQLFLFQVAIHLSNSFFIQDWESLDFLIPQKATDKRISCVPIAKKCLAQQQTFLIIIFFL
jgi:hypothetical protein